MLSARTVGEDKLYGNKEASADDLSDIQDKQFDYSHMKLVLMHLDKERRKIAISEAIRVAKKKAFFLDADWSTWGGTKTVEDFIGFIQNEINKYRVIDNYIGQKMEAEIKEVAVELCYRISRLVNLKQSPGNHYHYLIDLAKGSYTKIINERVQDVTEQERLRGELNSFIEKLEQEQKDNLPIEMATLVAVEVSPRGFREKGFEWASEADIQGIMGIEKSLRLEDMEKTSDKTVIERNGFFVHLLSEEELTELIKNKRDAKVVVYKRENKVAGYAIGCKRGLWKNIKPNWLDTFRPSPNYTEGDLADESIHILVATSKDASGTGRKLSKEIIEQFSDDGSKVFIGKVLKEPYQNIPSHLIHTRMGCMEVGEIEEEYLDRKYVWQLLCLKDEALTKFVASLHKG
jgi:SAM-dependent methyltransferase/predicted GNAT superfamily acetyltransferase